MPPSRCFLTKLALSFFFYFGNVFLYEFLALSDDRDVICYSLFYSLFFCVILFLFTFFLLLCLLSGIRFCLRIYIAMMRITNVMMISQYSYESRTWRWSDWQQGGDGPSCCRCLVYALFSIHLVDLLNIVVLHIVFSLYSMVRTAYYPHSWYPFDVDQGSGFRSRVSEVLGFTSIYKMKEAVNNEHRHFGDFPKLTSCARIMYNHFRPILYWLEYVYRYSTIK